MNCGGCWYYRYLDPRPGSRYHVRCCYFNLETSRSRRRDERERCLEYRAEEYRYDPSEAAHRLWELLKASKREEEGSERWEP